MSIRDRILENVRKNATRAAEQKNAKARKGIPSITMYS